jgi:hypothetical protein
MYTARQLIESAYRISGVKGVGETPTSPETDDALELLNGILDNFGMEQAFKPGIITREVTSKSDGSIVISNDGSRIITQIVSVSPTATITTASAHKLNVGTSITIQNTGLIDGVYTINGITSLTSFTIPVTVSGTVYQGTFKKTTESDAYLIDLAIEPPDTIINVVDGTTILDEYPSDLFYTNRNLGIYNGWYYETALDPYQTLYVDGRRTVTISFYQTGFRNINLNTDVDKWQMGMKEAVKWRLASDLAMTNGYLDMSTQCMNRFSEVIAKFRRSHRKIQPYIADTSAPGYRGGYYDISNDTIR